MNGFTMLKPSSSWLHAVFGVLQPKVVSDTDEIELARQLEKLEEANREVSGDDDADSYSEDEKSGGEDNKGGDKAEDKAEDKKAASGGED